MKLTLRENKGLTVTLNEAFAQSRGKYLARMDCDDVALPDRFAKQVELLDANPDVVCTGGYFQLIDGAGRLLTTLRPPTDDAEIQATLLKGHNAICHPSAMIRRTAMEKVGGYDTRFKTSQDLDLWLRLGEVGKLANVAAPGAEIPPARIERQRDQARAAAADGPAGVRGSLETPRPVGHDATKPTSPGGPAATARASTASRMQYGWWAFGSGERTHRDVLRDESDRSRCR